MSAGKAVLGFGSEYHIHDGADPGAYDKMGPLDSLQPPSPETEEREITNHGSANKVREFMAGLIDAGEASFTIQWDPGSDEDVILQALRQSGERRDHKMVFPTSGVGKQQMVFPGWIKKLEPVSPMDDKMMLTVTVRVTGLPVIGVAT